MFQQFTAIGHLGRDAEVRDVNDTKVISFSIATKKVWRSKDGQKQERTTWFRCSYFVKEANVAQYMKKGNLVAITGELEERDFEDKNGVKHTVMEVRVDGLTLMPSSDKNENENNGASRSSSSNGSSGRGGSSQRSSGSKPASAAQSAPAPQGADDEIPF